MSDIQKRLFSFGCPSLEDFEKNAIRAKDLGATHIMITADLPPAMWQYEQTGDPYTAWFVINPGLLTGFRIQFFQLYGPAYQQLDRSRSSRP